MTFDPTGVIEPTVISYHHRLIRALLMVWVVRPGTVWSWGDGDYGKLGRGGSDGSKTPKVIDSLQALGVVRVFCGAQFSVALTRDGTVWTW